MTLTSLTIHLPAESKDRSYPILIGADLISDAELISVHIRAHNVLIVTNTVIAPLHLPALRQALTNKRIAELILPDGEHTKTFSTLHLIFDALVNNRMNRDAAIIALGGGVVGDMAGFAAACYQRGIDYIQIPTTLLAQVDSSVGGKTAVNHPGGKNLIGAFHQPRAVIADINVLRTLSDREVRAGFAEVIKYGLIYDADFLSWLEKNANKVLSRDTAALTHAIKRSCEIKAEVVSQDEREHGLRAILNLGHTFGHAIENALGYGEWLHGEAVAAGMVMASEMSHRLGWISVHDHQRTINLIESGGLPIKAPTIGATKALALMGMDKKVLSGQLRLVLLKKLGQAVVTSDYPAEILQATLKHGFEAA